MSNEITKKSQARPITMWILGMLICPLGVAICTKAAFGLSMIEAPTYVLYLKLSETLPWFTFGTSEYVVQGICLVLMCIIIRKFKWRYLLSFGTAFLYGVILDRWIYLLGSEQYVGWPARILGFVVGTVIISFAVACFFRTWLPQEVWELFVKEVSEHKHFKMTKLKWIFDISLLAAAFVLMFVLLGRFEPSAVGIGTIITVAINAPLIGFFGKIVDKVWKPAEAKE